MPDSIYRRAYFTFTEGYVDVFLLEVIIFEKQKKV